MTGYECAYDYNYFIINNIIIIKNILTRKAITDHRHHHHYAVHQYLTRLKLVDVVASWQSSKVA